mmetsp:Transcript_32286/g.72840  ORF Transcript_32286/g.72840 Transcript_32286/m.72840 type:complete len:83 (+) Transcript_32286:376-624(+)
MLSVLVDLMAWCASPRALWLQPGFRIASELESQPQWSCPQHLPIRCKIWCEYRCDERSSAQPKMLIAEWNVCTKDSTACGST